VSLLEQVSQAQYEELVGRMPSSIDWSGLREMEREGGDDRCEYELACSAGGCEMVDVV
jgi:ribonucleoside-diphosphate reductase alpha chain